MEMTGKREIQILRSRAGRLTWYEGLYQPVRCRRGRGRWNILKTSFQIVKVDTPCNAVHITCVLVHCWASCIHWWSLRPRSRMLHTNPCCRIKLQILWSCRMDTSLAVLTISRATNLCLWGSRTKWRSGTGFNDGAGLLELTCTYWVVCVCVGGGGGGRGGGGRLCVCVQ